MTVEGLIMKHIGEMEDLLKTIEARKEAPIEPKNQCIERVREAMNGRKERAVHYKKLADRLGMNHVTFAVCLSHLKRSGAVECTRRGYFKAKD